MTGVYYQLPLRPYYKGITTLIDIEDYPLIKKYKWRVAEPYMAGRNQQQYYAVAHIRTGKTVKVIKLHRLIMNTPKGQIVDHADRNGLNNTRANLRPCTYSENGVNSVKKKANASSKYKGVWWSRDHQKWAAEAKINYKKHFLGRFSSEIDAAQAYDDFVRKIHPDFALYNLENN